MKALEDTVDRGRPELADRAEAEVLPDRTGAPRMACVFKNA